METGGGIETIEKKRNKRIVKKKMLEC